MALFSRKPKVDIDEMVQKAVSSALANSPMANAHVVAAQAGNLISANPQPSMVNAMAREMATFGGSLGPGTPFVPMPLDPSVPGGRPQPRRYQYDVADNLNVTKKLAQWTVLATAAVQCDLIARAISIRTADVVKMDWSFNVSKDAINTIMQDNNVDSSEAARIARKHFMPQIVTASEFWENPYPQSNRGWQEWITEALWQILVYDGLALHPSMTLGRDMLGVDIIDASTIKILLDEYGDYPRPPNPAFQQILYGFPRGEFVSSPNKNIVNFYDSQFGITERDQLSYFVTNRRTNTPYGFSPVEQSLNIANLYLEREAWLLAEYKFGTASSVYMKTGTEDITLENLAAWNRLFNDDRAGMTSNRQKTQLLVPGMEPLFAPTIDEKYKSDYDEHIIKRMASFFGIAPSQFGIIPRTGLGGGKGGAEAEAMNAETVSSKPMNNYLEYIVNSCNRRYMGGTRDVVFVLKDDEGSEDDVQISAAMKNFVSFGGKTLNTIQSELGLPLYDMPEADEPMIVTPTGPVFLKGMLDSQLNPPPPPPVVHVAPPVPKEPDGSQSPPPSPQGQEGQGAKGQEGSGSGETSSPELKAKEKAAYLKFAQKNRNRRFEFVHHSPEEADILKAGLAPRTKALTKAANSHRAFDALTRIAKKHSEAIHAAMLAGASGVATAVAHAVQTNAVDAAVSMVSLNTSGVSTVFKQIYEDAAAEVAAANDLPMRSATEYPSIADLLAKREITLKGISETAMSRVSTAISDGLTNGQTAKEIESAVNAVIADGPRSQLIATTETNRAYNAAFKDSLQASGETTWEWLADATACDDCLGQAGIKSMDDEPPPEHPSCRCMVVRDDSQDSQAA